MFLIFCKILKIVSHQKYSNVLKYSDDTKIFGDVIILDSVCTLWSDSSLISPRPAFIHRRTPKTVSQKLVLDLSSSKLERNSYGVTKGGQERATSVTISLQIWWITSLQHIFFLSKLDLDFLLLSFQKKNWQALKSSITRSTPQLLSTQQLEANHFLSSTIISYKLTKQLVKMSIWEKNY